MIRHDQVTPEFCAANRIDFWQLMASHPRSAMAKRAVGLFQQSAEGKALLAELRKEKASEWQRVKTARLWADRLGISIPSDNELNERAKSGGTVEIIIGAEKPIAEAIRESAADNGLNTAGALICIAEESIEVAGYVATFDGFDLCWNVDEAKRLAFLASEKRAADEANARQDRISQLPDGCSCYGFNSAD